MPKAVAPAKWRAGRESLLQTLEAVSGGLTARDVLEQSSCFAFTGKRVVTFDGEVACHAPSPLKGLTGAVPAAPLKAVLASFQADEVDVSATESHLVVTGGKGARQRSQIRLDPQVALPYQMVERAGDWRPLDPEFPEALKLARECAGRDESEFVLTCVHITPKAVEATDRFRCVRYKVRTPIESSVLVRAASLKAVPEAAPNEISVTESWAHFRAPSGVVVCCRTFKEEYQDLTPHFKFSGESLELPPTLADAAALAEQFSQENGKDGNLVRVTLRNGRLTVRGEGVSGWAEEAKKVKYSGPDLSFDVGPATLAEVAKRHRECEVTADRLKVSGGRWVFFAVLGVPGAKPDSEPE